MYSRRRQDRERLVLALLWMAYAVVVMVGCSVGRWMPTDPRMEPTPDPSRARSIETIAVSIGGNK